MPSRHDTRRHAPLWGIDSGQTRASDLDRIAGFPDIRIAREAQTVLLRWRFVGDQDPKDLTGNWTWEIERSGASNGPWRTIASRLPKAQRQFRDDTVVAGREETQHVFYRLIVVPDQDARRVFGYRPEWDRTAEGEELHGLTWEELGVRTAYAPGVIREIRQRVQMLVDHYAGTPILVYREAWLEGTCPACTNQLTGTRTAGPGGDYCRACLGTGFQGGYYTPMRSRYIEAGGLVAPRKVAHGTHDLVDEQTVVMPFWPLVEPRDLLRTADGRMYLAGPVNLTSKFGFPVLQQVLLSQKARTDPLSKIPMPADFAQTAAGPKRQYGRAMNLDSFAQSLAEGSMGRASFGIPDIFSSED